MLIALEKTVNEGIIVENNESMIPVRANIFRRIGKIKSSDLMEAATCDEVQKAQFSNCRNISHPRERQIQYLLLHNRFYNNKRLFDHKITESPLCHVCNTVEDNLHMLLQCPRATSVWSIVSRLAHKEIDENLIISGSDDKWLNNAISIGRYIICTNRSEIRTTAEVETRVNNRINDMVFIKKNSETFKGLAKEKNQITSFFRPPK